MARDESGVVIRRSRLPCARSSANDVAEVTLTIRSPIETMNAQVPGTILILTQIASAVKTTDITP
jgi:hypothetical protein